MNRWKFAFTLIGVGWLIVIPILAGTFVGLWLDGKFHTRPILALVGATLGVALGLYSVWRILRKGMGNKGE